jgi:16S rRNA (cytidine1402-2'-O)-methyltransferase
MQNQGTLYVVATPIGNLNDLSPRAREILENVDLIAAEDTRRTGRLLTHFGIKCRQIALHDHNEAGAVAGLLEQLGAGRSVALVSDAGTPLISDPGFKLVRAAHAHAYKVSPVPGPSALSAALSAAGLPSDRVCFEGFLPARASARARRLSELTSEQRTLVFYESVHRIIQSVADLEDAFGAGRAAFLGRELSKLHEQCVATTLGELSQMLDDGRIPTKGEFVLVVAGAADDAQSARSDKVEVNIDKLLTKLEAVLPTNQAAVVAAELTGRRRNLLYRRLVDIKARDK